MMNPNTFSRVLLVADPRVVPTEPGVAGLRRYRLARLRPDARPMGDRAHVPVSKRV